MHDPKRIVVFAGAGFSVPAGIPAMDVFVDSLRGDQFTPKQVRQLDGIMKECATKASLISENIRNLEVLSSFISMIKFTEPDFVFQMGDDSLDVIEAEKFMLRAISAIAGKKINSNQINPAVHLLEHLVKNGPVSSTIITTNYDMHFETAALRPYIHKSDISGLRVDLPEAEICNANSLELKNGFARMYTECQEAPLLIKMHGSVNWFTDTAKIKVNAAVEAHPLNNADTDPLDKGFKQLDVRNRKDRPLSWSGCSIGDGDPMLMLPTILKPETVPLLKHQWRLAAKAISEADQVWFVGYSFPESDSYMRYFLANSMAKNTRIRHIAIINPDRSVYFERAMKVFADARLQAIMKLYPYRTQDVTWGSVRAMDPLHRLRDENDIRKAELEVRSNRVLMGEYFESPDDQPNTTLRYRGRDRGRGRLS